MNKTNNNENNKLGLTVVTWNVQGLQDNKRIIETLKHLSTSKYDIICLQETHYKHAVNLNWEKAWKRESIWIPEYEIIEKIENKLKLTNLHDIYSQVGMFTWHSHSGKHKSRIDHILVSENMINRCSKLSTLIGNTSEHLQLYTILETFPQEIPIKEWKYEEATIEIPEYKEKVCGAFEILKNIDQTEIGESWDNFKELIKAYIQEIEIKNKMSKKKRLT
ncbi:hypothetical protein BB560_003144 [Smittium megazygosporum]|uniref:Endonuclease/exonuclease/phosphatase domain-containing protein n=1 Tax=Smittium megazygosporum TaxID=133381 RepID=A0A2T9ZCS5_9FUNG|nr:hypothetical protein BB560_003144 [Smittium megazygosporum]